VTTVIIDPSAKMEGLKSGRGEKERRGGSGKDGRPKILTWHGRDRKPKLLQKDEGTKGEKLVDLERKEEILTSA